MPTGSTSSSSATGSWGSILIVLAPHTWGTTCPRRARPWPGRNPALSFANSAIGARTNQEGGPGALAAAIIGRTPEYGLHLDGNRTPGIVVEVEVEEVDYPCSDMPWALRSGTASPISAASGPLADQLKTLAAAMAAADRWPCSTLRALLPRPTPIDRRLGEAASRPGRGGGGKEQAGPREGPRADRPRLPTISRSMR